MSVEYRRQIEDLLVKHLREFPLQNDRSWFEAGLPCSIPTNEIWNAVRRLHKRGIIKTLRRGSRRWRLAKDKVNG